ncbi:glycosyltransferase family A protein [Kaistia sp. MMO-174]|uniref:glycosyltransferase family A protein n=1 Tax=Kaistia sp. MMO-174 TaxID=3081256 RepID=UPI003019CB90
MDKSDFSIQNVGAGQLAMPGAIRLPLLSFVITGRPGSDFGPAIEALRIQDYPRFEVIVVEAGPAGDGPAALAPQVAADPRFKRVGASSDLGSFRLATIGLAAAEGEFVVFLDASELPSPGFASAHIQTHLASRHNVALTASPRHDDEAIQAGGRMPAEMPAPRPWLQPAVPVLRLASLDDDAFARLASSTALVEPAIRDWTASPATIQVYRRFVIDMLLPPDGADASPSSADAHFAPLCQWLGGSAAIRLPLLASRHAHAGPGASAGGLDWPVAGDRGKLGVWAANGAEFARRIGAKRYWDAFAAMLGLEPGAAMPDPAEIASLMDGPFAQLAGALGEREAIHQLQALLSRSAVLAILHRRYGQRLPLRIHWAIRSRALRQMHGNLRLYLRSRRGRRRQGQPGRA